MPIPKYLLKDWVVPTSSMACFQVLSSFLLLNFGSFSRLVVFVLDLSVFFSIELHLRLFSFAIFAPPFQYL